MPIANNKHTIHLHVKIRKGLNGWLNISNSGQNPNTSLQQSDQMVIFTELCKIHFSPVKLVQKLTGLLVSAHRTRVAVITLHRWTPFCVFPPSGALWMIAGRSRWQRGAGSLSPLFKKLPTSVWRECDDLFLLALRHKTRLKRTEICSPEALHELLFVDSSFWP